MIIKEKLAALPMCYTVTLMNYNGRTYCVSASEDRDGEIVMVDTETKEISKITGLCGGVMAIVPVPEENGLFLAIQKFYPVFDSKGAEVVCCRISGDIKAQMKAETWLCAAIPYIHRIALMGEPGKRKLLAGILSREKAFPDDWSHPGALEEYTLDRNFVSVSRRVLKEGITKHHGMYAYNKNGDSDLLVSGEEGVWSVDEAGNVSALCGEAVSDLCMYDVDGDGSDEMICIAPFHGEHMKVLKKDANAWKIAADEPVSFGHAIWCGFCGNGPLIISCSRSGDKATRMYRPSRQGEMLQLETKNVDTGVGAANIHVTENKDGSITLYAANHEVGEVARYTIMV